MESAQALRERRAVFIRGISNDHWAHMFLMRGANFPLGVEWFFLAVQMFVKVDWCQRRQSSRRVESNTRPWHSSKRTVALTTSMGHSTTEDETMEGQEK